MRSALRSRPGVGGDRGATVVLFGAMLTSLLTVTALAVDIGAAYTERRRGQNAADVGVMSGAVEAVLGGGVVREIVAEVRTKVDLTLQQPATDADWAECQDDQQLALTAAELASTHTGISPLTDCISFSATFDRLRVKVPDQRAIAVFGPSLGIERLEVSASATAGLDGLSSALPFVALSTADPGDFVCLRTSSAKDPHPLANGNGPGAPATFPVAGDPSARPDPCDTSAFDTAGENFGTLKPWRYEGCSQQNSDVEVAISAGLDHPMGTFPHGYHPVPPVPPDHPDHDDYLERFDGAPHTGSVRCATAFPNTFELDEGLNAGGLSCALIRAAGALCNGVTPRLQWGPYVADQPNRLLGIARFDNTPPWHFLRDSADLVAEGSPPSCVAVAASRTAPTLPSDPEYWDHYDRFDALSQCLREWGQETTPGSGAHYPENELFTADVIESARFGFVPRVAEASMAGIDWVHVEGFLPIFLYRVHIQESGPMCDPADTRSGTGLKVLDAGQTHDCGGSNKTIDRIASLVLACDMVPDDLCAGASATSDAAGRSIYAFRLTG